jgi:twinkle protein|tara:strand:+ start:54 stop:1709 length:1656 start_codon:yes stop_codon:yes gene_type:complete
MSFIETHKPCSVCNSSDGASINEDGTAKCFSCGTFYTYEGGEMIQAPKLVKDNVAITEGDFNALHDRGISLTTAKKYGVRSVVNSKNEVSRHFYPYYNGSEEVAYKTRFVSDKGFTASGPISECGLFGQHTVGDKGGKYITITEGECDAMAAYELLGSKWPVVSVKNGAQGAEKDVKSQIEFLEKFDNIVICFDADKPGQEAAKKVARLLKPNKAKIMVMPDGHKDANDMLRKNQHGSYVNSWWNAKTYTPSGVMNVSENKDKYHNRVKKKAIPYPWEGLNKKLEGLRTGELVLVAGGTGLGKTAVTRELEHWLIKQTEDNIGIVALEEDWTRTVDGILSIEANAKLHIDRIREEHSREELDILFDDLFIDNENNDRVWIHAHFGSNDIDGIFSKLRYMIVGCECKWVVIDHLHMMVSATLEGDERRSIDSIMTRLRSLAEETGAGLILVSHLRRIDGNKGHEKGAETDLSHLRGSQSIAQLSDCVITLERNQQADDPVVASTTRVRILKSRYTGDVGIATYLQYDKDTGRLNEVDDTDITFEEETGLAFE